MALLLAGLFIAVGIDQYIQKQKKRILLIICALVFSLIAQNFLDNRLAYGTPVILLRKAIDIYGYSIRPVILLLFLYIVSPRKPGWQWWVLIGVNAVIHLTALFTDICFIIPAGSDPRYAGTVNRLFGHDQRVDDHAGGTINACRICRPLYGVQAADIELRRRLHGGVCHP